MSVDDRAGGMVVDDTLTGGGDIGALMRAYDWASSPLGPVASWPRSLKTCVRIMLTSRQPMWLGWGDQLTFLYNDPYTAVLGNKHPQALGRPTADLWSEIWAEVGPRIQTTLSSGEGTFDEALLLIIKRYGYAEETYFTFSYSPVPNDQGGVGGLFCANSEETRRIIGERELALLRELATSTANVRTIKDACLGSARALAANQHDLPFALVYLIETDSTGRRSAVLAGRTNITAGHPAAPDVIALDAAGEEALCWPIAEVVEHAQLRLISDLGAVCPDAHHLPAGAWNRPPIQAVVLPIAASGGTGRAGVLVAGLNPYRVFDDGYRSFLELAAGQISAAIGSAQSYEDERRRAEMLAELDRSKTVFFSNVSHEFRTPLTLLLGPIEDGIADTVHPLPPVHRERQEAAQRNARRLLRLVNSLLDFSRIEAGREQVAFEATDLAAYTAELASTFRSAIEHAGLRFIVDCLPLPRLAYIDREMWEKVVLNLLSNALKFTFEGEIGVAVRATAEALELTVWDTGVGIAPDEQPRLFERFHRVQGTRARTHEGTGIGLALVQELVKLHGGTIRVQSVPDQGTSFTVSLPAGSQHLPVDWLATVRPARPSGSYAAPYLDEAMSWLPDDGIVTDSTPQTPATSASDSGAIDRASTPAADPAPETGRPRVLVVDDNRDMRDYVVRLLRQHYDVEAAGDGEAALTAAQARPPSLILSDVMMPHRDGFELVAALRADPRTHDVPIILLSARAGEEARADGMRSGADDYLVKPFSARELLSRVEARIALASARAEAEAERARLRILFEQAPAAVCLLDGPDHVFTLANPLYQKLVGQRDLLGRSVREVFPALATQGIISVLDQVYQEAEPYVGNEVLLREDWNGNGQQVDRYFNFLYAPVLKADGTAEGVFAHAYDVTDQVFARQEVERLARALARERDRIEQVLTSISDAFVTVDHDWRYTYVNDQATELLGRSRVELLGARVWDLFPEMVDSEAYRRLHEAAGQKHAVHFEDFNPALDRWFENRAYPSDGGLAILFSDITERKLTEYRLHESEERLRVALAGAQITVFTQDQDCRYTWIYNPVSPFASERVIGTTDLDHLPRDEAETLHAIKRRVMETGQGAREIVQITNAAGVAYFDLSVEPLRDPYDAIIGIMGSALDVTERQMLERAQTEFIAMASHELRNPLAAVRGFAQLMQRRQQYSDRAVDAILGQTRQLERLVGDLLDITRATAGRFELQRSEADLIAVAQAAVDEAQATTAAHRVRLRAPRGTVSGRWDADRIGQILRNLLSNAIKYAPQGGEILVEVRAGAADATIAVTDHGQGIPTDALPRLFGRFYRVEQAAGGASGLGLGLAITKTLVEAHGGRIEVASVLGQGSTFTVHLPYDEDGGTAPPATDEQQEPGAQHILIVDDDDQIRAILEQALLDEGYEVAVAADGLAALEHVQAHPPSLILLDVMMPNMDGPGFARQLDRQQLRGDIPIIVISAADRLRQNAAQIRAAAFLAKPFDLTTLVEMVGRLVPRFPAV